MPRADSSLTCVAKIILRVLEKLSQISAAKGLLTRKRFALVDFHCNRCSTSNAASSSPCVRVFSSDQRAPTHSHSEFKAGIRPTRAEPPASATKSARATSDCKDRTLRQPRPPPHRALRPNVCWCPPRLPGSSCAPYVSSMPGLARVPHRSGPVRKSWASAARAKPEPSVGLGSARAARNR
jgi:hypothetical protein